MLFPIYLSSLFLSRSNIYSTHLSSKYIYNKRPTTTHRFSMTHAIIPEQTPEIAQKIDKFPNTEMSFLI